MRRSERQDEKVPPTGCYADLDQEIIWYCLDRIIGGSIR